MTEVTLPTDYVTKRCKGYGIVSFMMPEDAVKALNEMDGKNFQVSQHYGAAPVCGNMPVPCPLVICSVVN